ncbi:hypothetical protein BYT27DRAFT_6895564 [Phlegmacium glaucopus]|nr:hypothetical protein BYT27DRAFT_6895564 [Phlegmacium glaucopus]
MNLIITIYLDLLMILFRIVHGCHNTVQSIVTIWVATLPILFLLKLSFRLIFSDNNVIKRSRMVYHRLKSVM